jgi:hypothetical protein
MVWAQRDRTVDARAVDNVDCTWRGLPGGAAQVWAATPVTVAALEDSSLGRMVVCWQIERRHLAPNHRGVRVQPNR